LVNPIGPNDKEMKPKKGHVVMVKMDIDEFYLQEDDDEDDPEFMPYIIPRLNYLIVGGMSQYSLDLNAKFEDQQKIIKKAAARFFPEIEKGICDPFLIKKLKFYPMELD
jgi:hypothetical protein